MLNSFGIRSPPPEHTGGRTLKRTQDDGRRWREALAAYRRAERLVSAADGRPDEDRFNRLNLRFSKVMARLLRTPDPHLPACPERI